MMHKYSCSIVGARGYTGLELAQALLKHEAVDLRACFATSDFDLSKYIANPKAKNVKCLTIDKLEENLTDFVFLATPADVSMELAPIILAKGKKVIDLSGAFRLKKNDYMTWYAFEHTQKELLQNATYGLVPFAQPTAQPTAKPNTAENALIANPGCYASSVLMALIPLLKNNLILKDTIVIDAKSGTTGAGKKASENLIFTEVDGECLPYKIGQHQHLPEIIEAVEFFTGAVINPFFTTHLLPTRRGIISSIYMKVSPNVKLADIEKAFSQSYANETLVQFGESEKAPQLMSLKKVVGTAKTHITYHLKNDQLFVFSTIDNLMKGAATQAIENLNRLYDLPTHTGLESCEALI